MFILQTKETKNKPSKVLLVSPSIRKDCFIIFKMIKDKNVIESAKERIANNEAQIISIEKGIDLGYGLNLGLLDDIDLIKLIEKELNKPLTVKMLGQYMSKGLKEAALFQLKKLVFDNETVSYLEAIGDLENLNLYLSRKFDLAYNKLEKGKNSAALLFCQDLEYKAYLWHNQTKTPIEPTTLTNEVTQNKPTTEDKPPINEQKPTAPIEPLQKETKTTTASKKTKLTA